MTPAEWQGTIKIVSVGGSVQVEPLGQLLPADLKALINKAIEEAGFPPGLAQLGWPVDIATQDDAQATELLNKLQKKLVALGFRIASGLG